MHSKIQAQRTPLSPFYGLPDFNYTSKFIEDLPGYEGLKIHVIDETRLVRAHEFSPKETFLCLHGAPAWSFVFRKMLPVFFNTIKGKGIRVVVPDLLGFGQSDKPTDEKDYSFSFHRNYLVKLIQRLDLKNITLVTHSLLGLTLPLEFPERFSRLIVMNGGDLALGISDTKSFIQWKEHYNKQIQIGVEKYMSEACPSLSKKELQAYLAPFPNNTYKAGVNSFANIIPFDKSTEEYQLIEKTFAWWKKQSLPVIIAVGEKDSVAKPESLVLLKKHVFPSGMVLRVKKSEYFVPERGVQVAKMALRAFELIQDGLELHKHSNL